jgi:hypothetical protein
MTPNDPNNPYNNQYGPTQQQQQWAPQQYPPAPNPYAYPYPAQVAYTPQNDSEATTIFVLGIVGVTACGFCAPIAWVKGASYRKTCQVMGVRPNGLATAGWIMGIVGTAIITLSILLWTFIFAMSALAS